MNQDMTYPEKAGSISREARKAAFGAAAQLAGKFFAANTSHDQASIDRLNYAREIGRQINLGAGRDQLLFNVDGFEFVMREVLPHFPPGVTANHVRGWVLISEKIKEEVKTIQEALHFERVLQQEFEFLQIIEARHHGEQKLINRDEWCALTNSFRTCDLHLQKVFTALPITQWSEQQLDSFLEAATPIAEKVEAAKKIRLGLA